MKTPRFVLSRERAVEQYEKVKPLADMVSYSLKTNPEVAKILEEETDAMFSIHTAKALKHLDDASRVIFIAQGWSERDVEELAGMGVRWFVVDNETDLENFLSALSGLEIEANLLLRMRMKEHTVKTERYYVFGMGSDEIERWVAEIRKDEELDKKLERLGIHFHRKTQNLSEWRLKYELENTFSEGFWEMVDVVDIGGGLPVRYANTNMDVLPGIFEKIRDLKNWLNEKGLEMVAEPGRFIAAPACRLETKVVSVHGDTVIVDASVYNGDLDAIVVPVKLLVEGELERGEGKPYTIKGVTPCSMDIFRYRAYLDGPKVGDVITFLNAGAYNFASDFCDLERIETVVE